MSMASGGWGAKLIALAPRSGRRYKYRCISDHVNCWIVLYAFLYTLNETDHFWACLHSSSSSVVDPGADRTCCLCEATGANHENLNFSLSGSWSLHILYTLPRIGRLDFVQNGRLPPLLTLATRGLPTRVSMLHFPSQTSHSKSQLSSPHARAS